MKKIIIIFISVVTLFMLPSCEDMMGNFLDKSPGVDVTEDTIFSSKVQVETFVTAMYKYGIHSTMPRRDAAYTGMGYTSTSIATDECVTNSSWVGMQKWNLGDITADNIKANEDGRTDIRFIAIRKANILLAKIEAVPELDAEYIKQVKGEALFVRALNSFEMFKRYGGISIVDKKLELTDNFNIPRSTIQKTVDFINTDCNEAISLLPNTYHTALRGRITKGAALALKAKLLLYAASPLFNTATPYLSMPDPANNTLICYGNADVNRWKLAADAAKAVIDWAPTNGIALIDTNNPDADYRYMCEICDNTEVILGNKSMAKMATNNNGPWQLMIPSTIEPNGWGVASSMTVNFMKRYEKQDGTPQTWDAVGGVDLLAKYAQLDRRFKQTIAPVGMNWNIDANPIRSDVGGPHYNGCTTGMWVMKFIPQTLTKANYQAMPNDILFRLGEAYLNFAEAMNEFSGPTDATAGLTPYQAINIIRNRAGQPDLPVGLSQSQFRDKVRNERAIEMFAEDQRLWDIRRWLIADQDGVMKGDMYGFKIYGVPTTALPTSYRYEVYKFETRTWFTRMYLHPYLRGEVLKGYLVQNPGY